MKQFIITTCLLIAITVIYAQQGLKFDKMIFIDNNEKTCPGGYIWQVQSIMNTNASLQESFGSSFLAGMGGGGSEADGIMKNQQKMVQLKVGKNWMFPSNFPFMVDEGTVLSSGNKARWVVVAQYKIE